MGKLSAVLRSFSAGAFGGVANVVLLIIIWQLNIAPGPPMAQDVLKGLLYKQMVWGGIWGFAFLIPVMTGNWILRGVVWGAAATAVALFVFHVVPLSVTSVIIGLVVNAGAWGLTASWLYQASNPAPQPTTVA